MMSVRRYLAAAAVSAAAAATLTATSGTATAAPQSAQVATFTITSASTGRCLDSDAAATVYTLNCNGGPYQKWENYPGGKFRNVATHLYLNGGVSGGVGYVNTVSSDATTSTSWTTTSTTNKYIKNAVTLTCLNNNGGNAVAVGLKICRAGTELWNVHQL